MKNIEHIEKFLDDNKLEPIEMVIICARLLQWDIEIKTSEDRETVIAINIIYPTED